MRLWREISPESEEAAQFYLSFTLIGDNLEEARPILEQRLKAASKPTLGATILQTQRLLSRARDKAAAFRLLEEVLADYKALPEMHLALAQAAHAAGDAPRAAVEAREALAISPSSDLAALTLAQVLQQHLEPLGVPAFEGALFGHVAEQFSLPVNARAEIDAAAGTIRLLEAAVA